MRLPHQKSGILTAGFSGSLRRKNHTCFLTVSCRINPKGVDCSSMKIQNYSRRLWPKPLRNGFRFCVKIGRVHEENNEIKMELQSVALEYSKEARMKKVAKNVRKKKKRRENVRDLLKKMVLAATACIPVYT